MPAEMSVDEQIFVYEQLPDAAQFIRLLRPQNQDGDDLYFTIKTFDRSDAPPYTAFSYAWGDPSLTKAIHIDGRLLPVTFSCYYALQQVIQHDRSLGQDKWYWIDAVCISKFRRPVDARQRWLTPSRETKMTWMKSLTKWHGWVSFTEKPMLSLYR